MLLFLDFDGVLHPQHERQPTPADERFCHLPRFEAVMRDFPDVQIVISSLWREVLHLDEMRAYFSPDIAARIIGTTPLTARFDGVLTPTTKESEILAWLSLEGLTTAPWIAIDDAQWHFRSHLEHLVLCRSYIGLDDQAEADLRASLAALRE